MRTEITDKSDKKPRKGWILYDGECLVCLRFVRFIKPLFGPRGFQFAPLQLSWVKTRLELPEAELLKQFWVLPIHGNNIGGADALVFLASQAWWGWPFSLLAKLPFMMSFLRKAYNWFAEHRHCVGGTCRIEPKP